MAEPATVSPGIGSTGMFGNWPFQPPTVRGRERSSEKACSTLPHGRACATLLRDGSLPSSFNSAPPSVLMLSTCRPIAYSASRTTPTISPTVAPMVVG